MPHISEYGYAVEKPISVESGRATLGAQPSERELDTTDDYLARRLERFENLLDSIEYEQSRLMGAPSKDEGDAPLGLEQAGVLNSLRHKTGILVNQLDRLESFRDWLRGL